MNKLKQVAKENKTIYINGFYLNNNNKKVEIGDRVRDSIRNSEYFEDVPISKNLVENTTYYKVNENIINTGTIDCILKLRDEGETGNIIALNFASATTPGGGYLGGSTAQEESLCRASMLYPCLTSNIQMYKKNKAEYSPLYSDRMIYSQDVVIFRNDNGDCLDEFTTASFITSPAVNKKRCKSMFMSEKTINKAMETRIRKIISLAVSKSPSVIILGAFGCGVFGNDRERVYKMFETAINELVPLDKVKVVFAVRKNVSRR